MCSSDLVRLRGGHEFWTVVVLQDGDRVVEPQILGHQLGQAGAGDVPIVDLDAGGPLSAPMRGRGRFEVPRGERPHPDF